MNDEKQDDYLWDRSGEPDPKLERLEQVLGTLKHQGTAPVLPARRRAAARWRIRSAPFLAAAAAAVLVLASGVWIVWEKRGGWDVQSIAGVPFVGGTAVTESGRLRTGDWLVTDAGSKARIEVAQIGRVDVDPNTRVQLVEAGRREHRLSLARGTIHAQIWAPPKQFYVNTPSSVAIDLGCAYTLQVDDWGVGLVRVTLGWVGFEYQGREAFIPQGAVCATRPGVGPGTPRYEDAPAGYADALAVLDFAPPSDPRRAAALTIVLSDARRRDALTLWHLLTRGTMEERGRVYDRMAELSPPPPGVTRERVLARDRSALDQWWDSLGLENATWWRLWKRTW
jgi:hypothetical protein